MGGSCVNIPPSRNSEEGGAERTEEQPDGERVVSDNFRTWYGCRTHQCTASLVLAQDLHKMKPV